MIDYSNVKDRLEGYVAKTCGEAAANDERRESIAAEIWGALQDDTKWVLSNTRHALLHETVLGGIFSRFLRDKFTYRPDGFSHNGLNLERPEQFWTDLTSCLKRNVRTAATDVLTNENLQRLEHSGEVKMNRKVA